METIQGMESLRRAAFDKEDQGAALQWSANITELRNRSQMVSLSNDGENGMGHIIKHPEGLDLKFTRQMTGKTRQLGVFSRQNRVFSRHKQMSSPSGKSRIFSGCQKKVDLCLHPNSHLAPVGCLKEPQEPNVSSGIRYGHLSLAGKDSGQAMGKTRPKPPVARHFGVQFSRHHQPGLFPSQTLS